MARSCPRRRRPGDAGAEGDQQPIVVVQEEALVSALHTRGHQLGLLDSGFGSTMNSCRRNGRAGSVGGRPAPFPPMHQLPNRRPGAELFVGPAVVDVEHGDRQWCCCAHGALSGPNACRGRGVAPRQMTPRTPLDLLQLRFEFTTCSRRSERSRAAFRSSLLRTMLACMPRVLQQIGDQLRKPADVFGFRCRGALDAIP
jgi:hypothetical protein